MGNKSGKEKRKSKRETKEYINEDTEERIKVCNEIIETEKTYIASLKSLQNEFMIPLLTAHSNSLLGKKMYLKPKQYSAIFSNIEDIINVQTNFLSKLESACPPSPNTMSPARCLGRVLSEEAPALKVYTTYINNYNLALTTLMKCQKKNPNFSQFLSEKLESENCHGLSLSSYLIMPIQRIPRYVLLFADLIKKTPDNHIDYKPTLTALDEIKAVADYVNEEKRIAEDLQELFQFDSQLTNYSYKSIAVKGRKFIEEGSIRVIDKKMPSPAHNGNNNNANGNNANNDNDDTPGVEMHYMLFNDLLLISSEALSGSLFHRKPVKKWKITYEAKLLNAQVNDLKDRHDLKNCFEIIGKKFDITVIFSSPETKKEFMDRYFEARAKAPVIDEK